MNVRLAPLLHASSVPRSLIVINPRKAVRRETILHASTLSTRSRRPDAPFQWIFRSNIPRRKSLYLSNDMRKRNFFGIGEVLGVLANPSQTLRSLTETKNLLEQTRTELTEARERAQITSTHTFSPLPPAMFFPRPVESRTIENILNGEPNWTVIFGASSTGKTAILRQVLSQSRYHVLHFDFRIAGFADLASMYTSLSQQMEHYFNTISETMEGYGDFEKEAWSFKHDRLDLERHINGGISANDSISTIHTVRQVKTSDIARLMEMFQSSLLKYRDFDVNKDSHSDSIRASQSNYETKPKTSFWRRTLRKEKTAGVHEGLEKPAVDLNAEKPSCAEKKIPVILFDEAHKLPSLVQSSDVMKCLLDAMQVLTKQDRLCHVIHATSDPFYQTRLRKANVMQHCKIITIGDCTKSEMRIFFRDRVIPQVPERFRPGLIFHQLYEAFGGKLAHWQDYVTDYVNANGKLDIKQSSHFLQAHAILNLQFIHSSESPPGQRSHRTQNNASASAPNLHTGGGGGHRIYSGFSAGLEEEEYSSTADFTATQLVNVMNKLTESENGRSLPYFQLCRELGVKAVDGMVKCKILELRWTDVVRHASGARVNGSVVSSSVFRTRGGAAESTSIRSGANERHRTESSGTMVNDNAAIVDSEEGLIVPASSDVGELSPIEGLPTYGGGGDEDTLDDDYIGPKLFPATPIMRFAMRGAVADFLANFVEGDSASEYASLSDVLEY